MENLNAWQYQKLNMFGFSLFNQTEIYCLIVLKARNQGVGKFGYFEVCEEKMSARLLALICRRWFCGVLHIRMFVSNFPFLFDQGSYYIRAPSSSS